MSLRAREITRTGSASETWDAWPSGSPRLAEALLSMDCELVGSIDAADHILFVGAITEAISDRLRKALLWSERACTGTDPTSLPLDGPKRLPPSP